MQPSQKTLDILDNFTNINDNLVITPRDESGTLIETKNVASNVFAKAEVAEDFDTDVAIYNLSELLSVIRLFDSPDIEFHERYLIIREKSGGNQVRYFYADKSVLCYPDKSIKFPGADVRVTIEQAQFAKIKKAASTLGVPNVSIIGEDGEAFLRAHDTSNDSTNTFDLSLGEPLKGGDNDFAVHFTTDSLNLLPVDYVVDLSLKGVSRFANADNRVEYFVAMKVS